MWCWSREHQVRKQWYPHERCKRQPTLWCRICEMKYSFIRESLNLYFSVLKHFVRDGGQLVVRVCEMVAGTPDVARTLVYVTNVQTLSCFNIQPSRIPTNLPSIAPTNSPQISDAPTPSTSSFGPTPQESNTEGPIADFFQLS